MTLNPQIDHLDSINGIQISDIDAAMLKAEFAQEDKIFAEAILPEYSSNLQQEDCA